MGTLWQDFRFAVRTLRKGFLVTVLAVASLSLAIAGNTTVFSLVNAARFLDVNPEEALRQTIVKFISRFRHIEKRAAERGRPLKEMSLAEMDALWEEAKKAEGE